MTKATLTALALTTLLTACGGGNGPHAEAARVPVGQPDEDGIVVKSRIEFVVKASGESSFAKFVSPLLNSLLPKAFADSASGSKNTTVTNAPSSAMTLDTSQWTDPTISNAVIDFGFLNVSALQDNNLKVCGANGKTKCNSALIRVYTTGQAGAGFWNVTDAYGAPITTGLPNTNYQTVGLGSANAVTLQTISVASSKNVVRLTDFSPTPHYNVKSDFTDAGAGDYTATIVVEYANAP